MAFSKLRIILLSSFVICLFLCVILVVNFEEPYNYRYMHQLSKLKFNYMFGSRLQINDTEGKRINDSEKKSGDRGCTTCTGRQSEEDVIRNITELQKCQWHKQELAAEEFRSELKRCCNAVSDCLVTQKNTPVGTELSYEAEPKRKLKITHQIFAILPKNSSFSSRQYKRCAVIGNGGILTNSSCGAEIDQADFVFRCNLPPVAGQFSQDVGTKTNLVTANPSIIAERYSELHDRRKPFFTDLIVYNDALLLLPAFSYTINTGRSFRALYTLQDFQAKQKVVFFNPVYLNRLAGFWRNRGIQVKRLSTGIMIVSLALELCEEVWIYGFWPFGKDIEGKVMPHHYFDNQLPKPSIHSMPTEFYHLLQMHSKGMIKLQMTHCRANPK
ncbi:alpha-2,8-sialyltransferase 8F-like isoform X2 [Scyliorhinus canicula]|uniref:alpha-2,8-sialyltransferase 8F-like isoform X2 n=1 Tax=Scyliorhinus canicula TaxID=7830 RepID=UPI0018F54BFC|nr:alpha-2,8-sialyltransferase 8F-like isoform X2 [Scyliorhinus canicula]